MHRLLQRFPRHTVYSSCSQAAFRSWNASSTRTICTVEVRETMHERLPPSSTSTPNSSSVRSSTPKRYRPTRVTDLYNALVYEQDSALPSKEWRKVMAIDRNGEAVSDFRSDTFRDRLECARQTLNAETALHVLNLMISEGLIPTPRAVVMAVETCIPAEEFELAEEALRLFEKLPKDHPAHSGRLITSAKTLLAVAYTSRDRNEDALRVMGIPANVKLKKGKLEPILDSLEIGRDTVAWGVLVKALTKMNQGEIAVDVVDVAMNKGIGMTDTLLHLTIDALRSAKRWRDAQWLFENAVEKGIVAREKTVASMLLALCHRDAKKKVDVQTILNLVDSVQQPSRRFLNTALLVLSSYGALQRAEEVFEEIGKMSAEDEYSYVWMMAAYGKYLDSGIGMEREYDPSRVYEEISEKADKVWSRYLEVFVQSGSNKRLRNVFLTKYLSAKTRCFKTDEAVAVCEDILRGNYKQFNLSMEHLICILSAIELACDVRLLHRTLNVMQEADVRHEPKSLAYVIGTYLGDGDMQGGLDSVRREMPPLVNLDVQEWQWTILLRRLTMLVESLKDAGVGEVKDLNMFVDIVKRKRAGVVVQTD